jgi:ankyrin repeat protein
MKTKSYVYGIEVLDGYDAWALFEACARGDLPEVEALLAADGRLVNAQHWYQFPIHMAVRAGHAEIVKVLLERGADPGQSRFTYNSWDKLLLCASERGYGEVAALLQDAMQRRFNYTPEFEVLKDAIIARDAQAIEAVARRQPDLAAASDALGNTALHWSVITRQLGLLKRFVELGAPIDAQRADGQTPVLLAANGAVDYWHRAARGRSHPSLRNTAVLVGSLLALGASYTLSVAMAIGDQERVEQLLSEDAGLARRLDTARINPLCYAARAGHLHLVRLLLAHGADPNMPEDLAPDGRALFEACCADHREVAELLLEHGANPNAGVDSSGCCLTICEVYHGKRARPMQQLLRQHGAYTPPYAMNTRQLKQAILDRHEVVRHEEFLSCVMGKRDPKLLDLYLELDPTAVQRIDAGTAGPYLRSPALVRHLLARGMDPNRPDWLGKTFLHTCAETGARSAAAIFLEAGAEIKARELEHHGTPLAAAVRACPDGDPGREEQQARMVEFLLKRGATANLPDDEPWSTPLAWANRRGLSRIAALLMRTGALEAS